MLLSGTAVGVIGFMPQDAFAQAVTITTSADFHGGTFFGAALLEVLIEDPAHASDPLIGNGSVTVDAFGTSQTFSLTETSAASGEFVMYVKVDSDESAAELPETPTDPFSSTMTRLYIGPAGVAGNYPPTSGGDVREELAVTSASIVEGGTIQFTFAGESQAVTYDDTVATITLDRSTAGEGNIIRVTMQDQDANLDPTAPEAFLIDNSILSATNASLAITAPSAFLETGDNSAQFEFPVEVAGDGVFTPTPGLGALLNVAFPETISIDLSDMKAYAPPSGAESVVSAAIDLENSNGVIFVADDPVFLQDIFRNDAIEGIGIADADRNIDSQAEDTIPAGGVTIAVEGVTATYTAGGATITTTEATSGIIGMDHELTFSSDPGQISFAVIDVTGTDPGVAVDPISVSVTSSGSSPDLHLEIPFDTAGPVTDAPLGTFTLVAIQSENVVDLTLAASSGDPYIWLGIAPILSMGPSNTQNLAVISGPTTIVNGIDFEETGDSTGGFEADTGLGGRIPLTVGSDSVSPTSIALLPSTISQDPAIVVTYFDPAASPSGTDVFHFITGISSDPASLDGPNDAEPTELVTLTLEDGDLDISSDAPDEITVPIAASEVDFLGLAGVPHTTGFFLTLVNGNVTEVPGYNVTFVETDSFSGVFEATVNMSMILEGLSVSDGDLVEFAYNDYYANQSTSAAMTISVPAASVGFDRAVYSASDLASVTVFDASADTGSAVDTVSVTVFSDTDLVGTDVTLTETGASTGVFVEDISFTLLGVSGGTTLLVSEGDTVTALYGSANATAVISPAIALDKTNYATESESPEVTVVDVSANTNPSDLETVTVSVESDTSGGPLLVTLDETDDDTGIFTNPFDLTTDPFDPCPTCLLVSDGDTITVTYIAPLIATATFGTAPSDTTPPVISAITDSPDPFSPNGDGINETVDISFTSDEPGSYTIMILDLNDFAAQNLTGAMVAGANNAAWDGIRWDSNPAADRVFKYNILAFDAAGNVRFAPGGIDGTITLDTTAPPAPVILNPENNTSTSNDTPILDGTVAANFLAKFGSGNYPGIAFDPDGSVIYVAKISSIEKFSPDGTLLLQWGSEGSADGQFQHASDVAVDSQGFVYVADRDNNRIQKFASDGTFVTKWGTYTGDGGLFFSPNGVDIGPGDTVYVVQLNANSVNKFNSSGAHILTWGSSGTGDGQFLNPTDVSVDSDGNVYVADTGNNRIQKFDASGNYTAQWGSLGSGEGQFNLLAGIEADSVTGHVYAAERLNGRIQIFDLDGNFIAKFGSPSPVCSFNPALHCPQDGQFVGFGADAAIDPETGKIYVADGARIQVFEPNHGQATVEVFDGTSVVSLATDPSSTWIVLPSAALADGLHILTAKVTDAAGNESPLSEVFLTINTTSGGGPVPTLVLNVSDTSPPWGVDVFANVTVTGAQAGDYVEVSWGNGQTFAYPAFTADFTGELDLTAFAYSSAETGGTFGVNATLYDSSDSSIAGSNTVGVTVDRRPATLTLRLPSSVVNGTIFTASGDLADGITGFGLPGRSITFNTLAGISLGAATTQGIEVVDLDGMSIVSCPVPQCTHDNPNASTVNLLELNSGATFDLPPGVTVMALTLQDMSGTVTVEVTRSDGSSYQATSDPAGINLATFMLSARDADHPTQYLQSVEILSTSLGEQFATSKIELSDADADPTTLISATFDLLPAGSYGSGLTIAPGAYYSSAASPETALLSVPVSAHFAGDSLYHAADGGSSPAMTFDTVLGFDLAATGIGGSIAIYPNPNQSFTVLSCSAADPDGDGDGLCDSWEDESLGEGNHGIPYACDDGTCLYALPVTTVPGLGTIQATSKDHKDIFVEIDAMEGHEPIDGALRRVIDAFAAAPVENPDGITGITLHVIKDDMALPYVGSAAGTIFNAWVDPVLGGNDQNTTNDYFGIKSVNYGTTDEERSDPALKNARANAIRYSLWVGNIGTTTTSGLAEDLGNDMIVSLGSFGGEDDGHGASQGTETEQAATFMHELGHTLNLKHGGPAEIVTEVEGIQDNDATVPSGGVRIYPRATTLDGYTVSAMGPGSGRIDLQQVVELGAPASINLLAVSEDPEADEKLGTPTITIDGASTSTTKIFNIHYPFEVPHAEPMDNADYAINFGSPNSGKYLRVQNDNSNVYDVTDEDFWMIGMFKRTGDSGLYERLAGKRATSGVNPIGYIASISPSDKLEIALNDGTAPVLLAVPTQGISLNTWYIWGASFDRDGNMVAYLYKTSTGLLSTATKAISLQQGPLTNTQTFTVGRSPSASSQFFRGQMDMIVPPQIGQTLTQDKFLAIAQGDFSEVSLTNLYDFDDGVSASDVIGNNHLTMHGSPTFSLGIANNDNAIQEMSLGQLQINFNVSPDVDIIGFGTPAYPSVTDIIPEDNSKNCKPNYQSILSYSRQMDNYLNGPGEHVLDYSRGNYAPLLETDVDNNLGLFSNVILSDPYNVIVYGSPEGLTEEDKVQKATTYGPGESVIGIDWEIANAAGGLDGQANINNLSIDGCNAGGTDEYDAVTFYDYNDWNNIKLDWKENALGTFDGITRAANKAAVEMTQEIAEQIENQVTTIQVDTLTDDKIIYGESIGVSGSTSNAPENAILLIDWGDGTIEEFGGVVDPLTGNWPLSDLLTHTYGSSATGERRIVVSLMDDAGSIEASSSGTTVLVLKDTTDISLDLTPSALGVMQQFTLTGTLSNLDHPGQGVDGRIITFTSSDPDMVIAPATTDASGDFMQTAMAGSAGSFEIIAHFEIPTDTDEDVVVLPSQSTPQTLVVNEVAFGGALSPIKADGSSAFKQKSTVPIKFQLTDSDGNSVTDAVATLRLVEIIGGVGGTEIAPPEDAEGLFKYDADNEQYHYNLKTKSMDVGTWGIRIYLDYGTETQVLLDNDGDGYTATIILR